MKYVVLACLFVGSSIACSAANGNNDFAAGGSGGSGSGAGPSSSSGDLTVGSGGSTSTGSSGCTSQAELVYVLSEENDLYSFAPDLKQFTKIGPLQCQTAMQPNSMAVDRNAVAWVNYVQNDGFGTDTDGAIFQVSTVDASCKPTSIKLQPNWYRLGMGFSTDQVGGMTETLYIGGTGAVGTPTSPGLGMIDFGTQSMKPIGQYTGNLKGQSAELTGTGDARLFGFFTTTPVEVGEINKSNGSIISSNKLGQVETPAAWAFSFWGGSFYLYTCPDPTLNPNRTTNVTKYDPVANTTDTQYMTNIGFRIVGAGVSTCAPIVPPK